MFFFLREFVLATVTTGLLVRNKSKSGSGCPLLKHYINKNSTESVSFPIRKRVHSCDLCRCVHPSDANTKEALEKIYTSLRVNYRLHNQMAASSLLVTLIRKTSNWSCLRECTEVTDVLTDKLNISPRQALVARCFTSTTPKTPVPKSATMMCLSHY